MSEFNPVAEAERLAAEAAKAGATIKTDAETIVTDVETDAEKVVAEVKPTETTVETDVKANATTVVDALKTAQTGLQQGVAAAKVEALCDVDVAAQKAHGLAAEALEHIEDIPAFLSGELGEAKLKLKSALSWIEAHFTTQKATPPAAAPTPPAS
jgi:flagellar motor switch/type III secretory pathway protein FliN